MATPSAAPNIYSHIHRHGRDATIKRIFQSLNSGCVSGPGMKELYFPLSTSSAQKEILHARPLTFSLNHTHTHTANAYIYIHYTHIHTPDSVIFLIYPFYPSPFYRLPNEIDWVFRACTVLSYEGLYLAKVWIYELVEIRS